MTDRELRSKTRVTIAKQPKGTMCMLIDGKRFPVRAVRNISEDGTSLLMDGDASDFGEALQVTLEYKAVDGEIIVNGIIVWSRPSESMADEASNTPMCVLGISLLIPHVLMVFTNA